jgi:hypothetical protein
VGAFRSSGQKFKLVHVGDSYLYGAEYCVWTEFCLAYYSIPITIN